MHRSAECIIGTRQPSHQRQQGLQAFPGDGLLRGTYGARFVGGGESLRDGRNHVREPSALDRTRPKRTLNVMYLADLSQERFPGQCRLQDCRLSNERIGLAAKFVLKISGLTTVPPPNSSARSCWRVISPSTTGSSGQASAGRDRNGGSGSKVAHGSSQPATAPLFLADGARAVPIEPFPAHNLSVSRCC